MPEAVTEQRIAEILERLAATYPDAQCSLNFSSPFQLLVATILSAQCTDDRVNSVTPALFELFPTPAAFAAADIETIEQAIRSTGFFRNKARHIQEASVMVMDVYGGSVPSTMEELLKLPGVARKTANVVLGNGFGLVAGVVVDTHVGRISRRLGITSHRDPVKIEKDLMAVLPREHWLAFNHRVIYFGRAICKAPRAHCEECFLTDLCPSAFREGA